VTDAGLSDEEAMAEALVEARAAAATGDVPVGAVVVVGGRIVARGHNEREATGDPTAHAEIVALRRAATALGRWRLDDATVYATLEPCPMCAGALVAARVAAVVFGPPDPKAGACGSLYNLCTDPRLNHEPAVTPGVLADEASALLTSWFAARRHDGDDTGEGAGVDHLDLGMNDPMDNAAIDEPAPDDSPHTGHRSLLDRLRGTGVGTDDPNIVGDAGPTDVAPGSDPPSPPLEEPLPPEEPS